MPPGADLLSCCSTPTTGGARQHPQSGVEGGSLHGTALLNLRNWTRAQAGAGGGIPPLSLPWGHTSSDTQERRSPSPHPVLSPACPNTLASLGPMPVNTDQATGRGGGGGRGAGSGGVSGWQSCLGHTPAPGTPPPPGLWCRAQEKSRGGGVERREQGGARRFCGSVCGKVFFSPFFPFFLCKKCTKARQPLCNRQQCFLGEGGRGGDPRPGTPAWD